MNEFHELRGGLIPDGNICIVGDVHGCYDVFIRMLSDDKGYSVDGKAMTMTPNPGALAAGKVVHHILVGDVIDKGPDSRKMIEFLFINREHFTMVLGNHERWVMQYITGKLQRNADNDHMIENYFDTVRLLEADALLKSKFLILVGYMVPFAEDERVVVTHAPCKKEHICQTDKVSIKAQNTIRYPKRKDFENDDAYLDARAEFFKFIIDEADDSERLHVFGHVPIDRATRVKNKFAIDCGCVSGGFLATLNIQARGRTGAYIKKYESNLPRTQEKMLPLFRVVKSTSTIDFNGLEGPLKRRIRFMAENKVNFVAGTMSPADKFGDNLESLEAGVQYFRESGVDGIVIQPKFMGSRCTMLIHRDDITKCKALSRNAFEIRNVSADKTIYELMLIQQHDRKHLFEELDAEYILFDGELMPWRAMSTGMIEKQFLLPHTGALMEEQALKESGFYGELQKTVEKLTAPSETPVWGHQRDMRKVYDANKHEFADPALLGAGLREQKKQIDMFSAESTLTYKAFSILKVFRTDGSEENWIHPLKSNADIFGMVSKEPHIVVDFKNDTVDFRGYKVHETNDDMSTFGKISEFWTALTFYHGLEGVVIKPIQTYVPDVAPYMKVRNHEYLRMVYGFDYDILKTKQERLLERKTIRRKLATSIKEWELGKELLDIPMDEISTENQDWLRLVLRMITEHDSEADLDPRL